MSDASRFRLDPDVRRSAMYGGHLHGVLWGIGNALTSGTLLIYLSLDLGAKGIAISSILAAPSIAGLLRVFTPWLIRLLGGPRRACLIPFALSYVLILGQPAMAVPGLLPWDTTVGQLVALVCVHQLLEYIGLAVFYSWLGEIVPLRIRGRYFARRQIFQLAFVVPTLFISGAFTDYWRAYSQQTAPEYLLLAYAIPAAIGALFLQLSLLPLRRFPEMEGTAQAHGRKISWSQIAVPFYDSRFRMLLLFGCVAAFANGLTQAAQNIYPKEVLAFGVVHMAWFRTAMRMGQIGYSHWAGPFSDRFGNRPVLILSQAVVALGPLFFLLASPSARWWLAGAWIAWAAFAGLNICLPNFMLKISSSVDHAAYIATYFGVANVVYATATVMGGVLHTRWSESFTTWNVGGTTWSFYDMEFVLGCFLRFFGVIPLFLLVEPGAWKWKQILGRTAAAGD